MVIGTSLSLKKKALGKKRCFVDRLIKLKDILEIQQAIIKAARKSLEKLGFLEIIPPILATATDPGLRGAKYFTVDFYGKRYKLTSSMIMHKIVAASALGKVFAISPCLRKEKIKSAETKRHLAEFWQIDVEMLGDRKEAMKVAEILLRDVIKEVVKTKSTQLKKLGRRLKIPALPFKRITYKEAIKLAKKLGCETDEKQEIPWEAEKILSMHFKAPFFIVDYPKGSRGFYDKTVFSKQLSFDIIYPEGYGEAASGSEREIDPKLVVCKLRSAGEKPEEYKWFVDLLREGKIKQTSGFGIGVERLTKYICGLKKIEDATPFPKLPGGDAT